MDDPPLFARPADLQVPGSDGIDMPHQVERRLHDLDVVYPVDRLTEMAADGVIGSVNDRHISFMGAQLDATYATMIHDTGPAAAQILLDDGVDVVLLTPV
jgi:hypothetical protein